MLNKNDPLIAAVQKVMQANQAEREAVALVNEKFGVADRRALPRERQHEWDSAYAKVLTEGVEALDELKGITNNTGARAGYMLKGIGSAVGAKLTGDKKTYNKRMKGLEGAKKKSEAATKKGKEDAANNETARKVLKDMGRKTGYGKIYDKMFEEEALDEKIDPSEYSEKQKRLAGTAGDKTRIDGPDLRHVRKHGGKHIEEESDHVSTKVKLDNHGSDIHAKHEKEFGVKITHPADGKGPSTVSGPKNGMQGYLNRVYDSGFSPERAHPHVFSEEKKMKGDDPCWDNYEMIGMKKKGGKEVPNCVPVKEEGVPGKAIPGDVVTGSGSVTPVPVPKPKPTIGDADRKQLTDKIKSIVKEATEKQKNKVGEVMREFKRRELHSGKGGPVVTDPKQAIAISLSQAGLSKKKKKLEEGFNNRHDLSVTASVEKQVVADQLNEKASPAVIAADKKRNPRKGETLGNIVRPLIPGVNAAIKAKEGDYAGAAKSAAFDVGATVAGGLLGRTALKYGSKVFNYLRNASKTAPATSQVTNRFRANVANRRYNVSGAQQKPPQNVAQQSTAQGSVPSVSQGTGQANRLAAPRRPESGPWGSAPPAASASKLKVAPGGFAANLQRARQQAQQARVGGSTVQATQSAARTGLAQQAQSARVGVSTVSSNLARKTSDAVLGGTAGAVSMSRSVGNQPPRLSGSDPTNTPGGLRKGAAIPRGSDPTNTPGGLRKGAAIPRGSDPTNRNRTSTAGKDKPGTGPGQGSGAPTGPENIKMATQNTQGNYDKMTFSQAFAAARKQAGGGEGKFKYKGREYQTNVKGTGTATKPQEKYQASSKLKTVAPPTQTTTTSSVAGGQGIAALPSGPAKSAAPVPTARPANVGSTGPARPTMAANAQAAGQMAVDRMRAQNMAKSQTSSMSAGMSSTAPAPKQKPTFGGPR